MDDIHTPITDHDRLIRIDERTEAMKNCLATGKKQFAEHDTRIKRIEIWFFPVLIFLSIVAHKIFNWVSK